MSWLMTPVRKLNDLTPWQSDKTKERLHQQWEDQFNSARTQTFQTYNGLLNFIQTNGENDLVNQLQMYQADMENHLKQSDSKLMAFLRNDNKTFVVWWVWQEGFKVRRLKSYRLRSANVAADAEMNDATHDFGFSSLDIEEETD